MRFLYFVLFAFLLPITSVLAETKTPYGWNQCTTTFDGDTERCLDFVKNICTKSDQVCLANHVKAWVAFGLNTAIAEPLGTDPSKISLLSVVISQAVGDSSVCEENDFECILEIVVPGILEIVGPGTSER